MMQGKRMNAPENSFWPALRLADVIAKVRKSHGLDLSPYDETFLAKALIKRQAVVPVETLDGYIELLGESSEEASALQHSLSIVYSEFFRNTLSFALLEQVILPHILEEKDTSDHGEIRVWSASCATGQEAWSVAILLEELRRKTVGRVIATDQSEPALAVARAGVYGIETMGNIRLRHLDRFFSRQGASYVIDRELSRMVTFAAYDLLDETTICPPESIFGNFDLVLCCNVLFYYRQEIQQLILQKIWRCLAPGGYLITDVAERQIVENAGGFLPAAQAAAVFKKIPE